MQTHGGFVVHVVRSDVTNGKVWHVCKLHLAEFNSVYVLEDGDDGPAIPADASLLETSVLGDVLVVPDGSGATCRGMFGKQAGSVGCPAWKDEAQRLGIAPVDRDAGTPFATLRARLRHQHSRESATRAVTHQIVAYVQCTETRLLSDKPLRLCLASCPQLLSAPAAHFVCFGTSLESSNTFAVRCIYRA